MRRSEEDYMKHPEWANQTHTDYNNGLTCNCPECVEKRGFFLCTMPIDPKELIFVIRENQALELPPQPSSPAPLPPPS